MENCYLFPKQLLIESNSVSFLLLFHGENLSTRYVYIYKQSSTYKQFAAIKGNHYNQTDHQINNRNRPSIQMNRQWKNTDNKNTNKLCTKHTLTRYILLHHYSTYTHTSTHAQKCSTTPQQNRLDNCGGKYTTRSY